VINEGKTVGTTYRGQNMSEEKELLEIFYALKTETARRDILLHAETILKAEQGVIQELGGIGPGYGRGALRGAEPSR
jgi:hypothetical protein